MIDGTVGDRLVVNSERTGAPPRAGVIVEVLTGFGGIHYRVRWDDAHESTYFPGGADFKIVPAAGKSD